MAGAFIANWPIALMIVLAVVCIPLWMTTRRKHAGPDYRNTRACYEALPADRVTSLDYLRVTCAPDDVIGAITTLPADEQFMTAGEVARSLPVPAAQ